MEKNSMCQVDDNISSKDVDMSTVSSEGVHSAHHSLFRSDVTSGIGQALNEKRKNNSVGTPEEISQGDSTTMVPRPHKLLKTGSSSSKNSFVMASLSSVDSVDPKPAKSSRPTQSAWECDLNEVKETNSVLDQAVLSEPIHVVAKVGIPMGFPKKPLQFGGALGWKRSGITSAFSPTSLKNPDVKKTHISRGFDFDLNIAPATDPEDRTDEASLYVGSTVLERLHFTSQGETENCHRPPKTGIDLNHRFMIEESRCQSIYPQVETRKFLRNSDSVGTVACSGGNPSPNITYMRPPYWVHLSSVQGYGHAQGQPLLLAAPSTQQLQMVVPIQLPHSPPSYYTGKVKNLSPAFYPSLHNQPGPAVFPTYPGNVGLIERSQGLKTHVFENMRQAILPNGNIALMEKLEQVSFPASFIHRKTEPNARWGSSQVYCTELASWK